MSAACQVKVKVKLLSCVRLFATPWTVAYQTSLSMGFSRQEYWSGVPLPSPLSHFSRVQLFATPWTVACQAPLSIGFLRQEYCSGLPFPTSENLPDPETEPTSLASPSLGGVFFTSVPPEKPFTLYNSVLFNFVCVCIMYSQMYTCFPCNSYKKLSYTL